MFFPLSGLDFDKEMKFYTLFQPDFMKGLIPKKYCIYLDQFAVSNMVDNQPDWMGIKDLLQNGVSKGLFVCPVPYEHFIETAQKVDANALLHDEFLRSLSDGYYFKAEPYLTAQLMISAIRKNNITANTFLSKKLDPNFSFAGSINKFRGYRKYHASMVNEVEEITAPMAKMLRGRKIDPKIELQLIAAWNDLFKFEFCDRLKELIDRKALEFRRVDFRDLTIPHWIDYLLEALLKVNKMSIAESKTLLSYVKLYGFDRTSTMDVRFTINAYRDIKHKKETPNDQLDIVRIATAIQISDIMFVDKTRKFELAENGLDKKYGVELFSGTKQDLQRCEQLLKSLVGF